MLCRYGYAFPYPTRTVVCYVNIRWSIFIRLSIFLSFVLALKNYIEYFWRISIKKYITHFSFFSGYHICETEDNVESPGEGERKQLLPDPNKMPLGTNKEGTRCTTKAQMAYFRFETQNLRFAKTDSKFVITFSYQINRMKTIFTVLRVCMILFGISSIFKIYNYSWISLVRFSFLLKNDYIDLV